MQKVSGKEKENMDDLKLETEAATQQQPDAAQLGADSSDPAPNLFGADESKSDGSGDDGSGKADGSGHDDVAVVGEQLICILPSCNKPVETGICTKCVWGDDHKSEPDPLAVHDAVEQQAQHDEVVAQLRRKQRRAKRRAKTSKKKANAYRKSVSAVQPTEKETQMAEKAEAEAQAHLEEEQHLEDAIQALEVKVVRPLDQQALEIPICEDVHDRAGVERAHSVRSDDSRHSVHQAILIKVKAPHSAVVRDEQGAEHTVGVHLLARDHRARHIQVYSPALDRVGWVRHRNLLVTPPRRAAPPNTPRTHAVSKSQRIKQQQRSLSQLQTLPKRGAE